MKTLICEKLSYDGKTWKPTPARYDMADVRSLIRRTFESNQFELELILGESFVISDNFEIR